MALGAVAAGALGSADTEVPRGDAIYGAASPTQRIDPAHLRERKGIAGRVSRRVDGRGQALEYQ